MTYGAFLAIWLLPALLAVAALVASKPLPLLPHFHTRSLKSLWVFLAIVALLYTTPWDNYLVANHIWTYPPERVWGIRLGWVPLEEYLFFVLQTTLTTLWLECRSAGKGLNGLAQGVILLYGVW
jgi:putative membrane protein